MKNIIEAIAAEENYLRDKTTGDNRNLSLYDYISAYGYDNLSNFREDKTIHQIKELGIDIIEITSDQVENEGNSLFVEYLNRHRPCLLWNTSHTNMMYVPLSCNRPYSGYTVIKPGYDCESSKGNIMSFDGDLDVVMILPKRLSSYFKIFTGKICKYFSEQTSMSVTLDGNDILVDGYKVSGQVRMEDEEYSAMLVHFSFTKNQNQVMTAMPGAIKKPGNIEFTTKEIILSQILSWLQ